MKLYGSNMTPYGRKVRITLAEKGLDYERDSAPAAQKPPAEMATLNPGLRVPVLEDEEQVLFDSNLIIKWLLGAYPDAVAADAPAPPFATGLARATSYWEDRKVLSVLDTLLEASVNLRQLALSGVTVEQSSYLQRHQERIRRILDWLERRAHPDGLLPGIFSIQDVSLVCALEFGAHFDLFQWEDDRPRLAALMGRLTQRPSVLATRIE